MDLYLILNLGGVSNDNKCKPENGYSRVLFGLAV